MADGTASGAQRRRMAAVADIGRWIEGVANGARSLTPAELAAYPGRGFATGWRVPISSEEGLRQFDVLIGPNFPWEPARIALVDHPPFLAIPHMEKDGILCILPNQAAVATDDPVGAVVCLLADALEIVEEGFAGSNQDDFRSEFLSYWQASDGAPEFQSLLTLAGPTRLVSVCRLASFTLVAETDEHLLNWLRNSYPGEREKAWKLEKGCFLWLEQALLPSEYPATGADLSRLVIIAGGKRLIDRILRSADSGRSRPLIPG